jgi:DNA-binding response OmpR family regulator
MNATKGPLLIVEDIPDILQFLELTLKFHGYQVSTARNGKEALEAIEKERPAILITDILMPQMDGFTLVQRVRIDPVTHNIPVVFISATYIAPEDKAFAMLLGATHFIEKPIDTENMLVTIENILMMENSPAPDTLSDREFYENYRKRLETKLRQKNIQIERNERLLETLTDKEKPSYQTLLKQTIRDRDEIQHELSTIREHLTTYEKKE